MRVCSVTKLTYDQFLASLRSALHYLYDPVRLRGSPLVDLFGLVQEFDKAAALQQRLIAAIRTLKPSEDEPAQSRAWRVYDTLSFQYIRQLTRDAVAMQLGISERQLRREQRVALEVLAQHLWPQLEDISLQPLNQTGPAVAYAAAETDHALSEELVWLKKTSPEQLMPLGAILNTVYSLVQPLAQQWQVSLQIDVQPDLADLPVAPLALRSILLTILNVAMPRAGRRPVVITATRRGSKIEFKVTCNAGQAEQLPISNKEMAGLEMAQNLSLFYGAQLSLLQLLNTGFALLLAFPAPEQIPVLIIDDNADWLQLIQRYAVGSRYQVIGTSEPESARSLAEKVQPAVILLDVMMHNVDGWQILSELRHTLVISRIPIVICTILPVEDLARSLGANAFLQKPITQQQFLQILDQQSSFQSLAIR